MGDRARFEIFSDAVFAVAITLLVLNLPLGHVSGPLLNALADRWPSFAAFGISFVIVGCIWVSHFRLCRSVQHIDVELLFLNLALLMTIVLVPFGASLMATFVTDPGFSAHLAAALFAGVMLLMGIAFTAVYLRVNAQLSPPAKQAARDRSRIAQLRDRTGLLANAVAVGLAFVSAQAVLILISVVAVFYIVDQVITGLD